MADFGKFPGTEMEVFSKYPDSYRLDHPDLGDVRKTFYAKGVITEFKKISDDPVRLASQVKVEVDGQESGFIPLFYHPKAQYWDDDDALATDVNQDDLYFEKAGMSFQSGDEVAVMFKEDVAVAAVGFADGVPRLGENVFKITWEKWNGENHFAHIQARAAKGTPTRTGGWLLSPTPNNDWAEYGSMDVVPAGPDGLALGLTQAVPKLCDTAWQVITTGGMAGAVWDQNQYYRQYMEYLIRLGGKLYILQLLNSYIFATVWNGIWVGPGAGDYTKGDTLISSTYTYYPTSFAILGAVDSRELFNSTKILGQQNNSLSPLNIYNGDYSTPPDYNDFVAYPGFQFQEGCSDGLYWYLNSFRSQMFPSSWVGNKIINSSTIKIYVRPHTKEELQAANMWPVGAS